MEHPNGGLRILTSGITRELSGGALLRRQRRRPHGSSAMNQSYARRLGQLRGQGGRTATLPGSFGALACYGWRQDARQAEAPANSRNHG